MERWSEIVCREGNIVSEVRGLSMREEGTKASDHGIERLEEVILLQSVCTREEKGDKQNLLNASGDEAER